jgi:hypothetical protein
MPDEPRGSVPRRVAAWWRRGYEAELLALAPDVDERGVRLVWDFAHPVNDSPGWRLLRPWVLIPALIGVAAIAVQLLLLRSLPQLLDFGGDLVATGAFCTFLGFLMRAHTRPRTERAALDVYRRYRWRGTSAMDDIIAAAREREHRLRELADPLPPGEGR